MKTLNDKTACGTIFISKDSGRALLNLRAPDKSHALTWGLWGGMSEGAETPIECLKRELTEEIGYLPDIERINPFDVFRSDDGHFTFYSYVCLVDKEFIPVINREAVGYCWTKLGIWPSPMHRGAKETLCNKDSLANLKAILNGSLGNEQRNLHQ